MPVCRRPLALLTLAAVAAWPAAGADAAVRIVIKGRGFGHGVGMSQYGAFGFAQQGWTYDRILGHYYRGTALGQLDQEPEVRVLLQSSFGGSFSGAVRVAGQDGRKLDPDTAYSVARTADGVALRTSSGRVLATYASPLRVQAPADGSIRLGGTAENGVKSGRYRGALEFRAGAVGGLLAINAVMLEDYVRGVVSRESPSSWPAEALKSQAAAARTYAITTNKPGDGFEQYADVRSQVYGGVSAERTTTDEAVAATRLQVVTYDGAPVVTYFFSTSGGRTENVENAFAGARPAPYLRSVEDPYDDASPKHRWGPIRHSISSATRRLKGLVKGRLQRIKVIKRGVSPRIIKAQVIGTGGTTVTTGPELRRRFGLYDTWATFTRISTTAKPAPAKPTTTTPPTEGDPGSGGTSPEVRARASRFELPPAPTPRLVGRIQPARTGSWLRVERRARGRWVFVADTQVERAGRYAASVPRAGEYRVVHGGVAGPTVRVR